MPCDLVRGPLRLGTLRGPLPGTGGARGACNRSERRWQEAGLALAMTVTRFAVDLGVLPVALDLGGTFVFALSGGAAGVKHRLDVFGALVSCR